MDEYMHLLPISHHSHTIQYLGFTEGLVAGQLGATVVFESGRQDLRRARRFFVDNQDLSSQNILKQNAQHITVTPEGQEVDLSLENIVH